MHDQDTKAPRQLALFGVDNQNPLCACGCRRNVRMPQHRYLHGHSGHGVRRGLPMVDLRCPQCGQSFRRYPSQVSLHCSRACAHLAPHRPRAYPDLRRDFFAAIDTPEKAYVLGFVMADGYVNSNGRGFAIGLKEADRCHLETLQTLLGGGGIRTATRSSYGSRRSIAILEVCSISMVRDLAPLGVYRNKVYTTTYPALTAPMDRHFVRGLWDGDGWIGARQFTLVGTESLLTSVRSVAHVHTGCTLTLACKKGHWNLTGSRRDAAVLDWMHADTTLWLPRKHDAWLHSWTPQPQQHLLTRHLTRQRT